MSHQHVEPSRPTQTAHGPLERQEHAAPPAPAARVLSAPDSLTPNGVLALQRAIGNRETVRLLGPVLRRKKSDEGDGGEKGWNVAQGGIVAPAVEQSIRQAKGGGHSLDDQVRRSMEEKIGADFSAVRVHTSVEPDRLNRSLNSRAFSTGQDLFFRQGEYSPGSHQGQQLIAHELTHVVQQTQAGGSPATAKLCTKPAQRGKLAIQRKSMTDIMAEQDTREKAITEGKAGGRFTTVGFEWDIAKTADDSPVTPNPLEGLTHLKVAKSDFRWNGLPYYLETDAGNTLELVTPPFLVSTRLPGEPMPLHRELIEIIAATRQDLSKVVKKDATLGTLMDEKGWKAFRVGNWSRYLLTKKLKWENWSWRSKPDKEIRPKLNSANIQKIQIKDVTLNEEPQINFATSAESYDRMYDPTTSRLSGHAVPIKVEIDKTEAALRKGIEPIFNRRYTPKPQRIILFMNQLIRVLAQQHAVPYIEELANWQQQGLQTGKVKEEPMKDAGESASYIKDVGNVWLKTDLLSYGLSILEKEDWPEILTIAQQIDPKGILATPSAPQKGNKKPQKTQSEPVDSREVTVSAKMEQVIGELTKHAKVLAETEAKDIDAQAALFYKVLMETVREKRALNVQNPKLLGVRQDTFIKSDKMLKSSDRLKFNQMLHVVEVRSPELFLEWLKADEKPKKTAKQPIVTKQSIIRSLPGNSNMKSPPTTSVKTGSQIETKNSGKEAAKPAQHPLMKSLLLDIAKEQEGTKGAKKGEQKEKNEGGEGYQEWDEVEDILFEDEPVKENDPVVDENGDILEAAREVWINAYKADLLKEKAYLSEAEGTILAKLLKIAVNVYQGTAPQEFEIIPNPGGGDCLLYSLGQVKRATQGYQDDNLIVPENALLAWRSQIEEQLKPKDILRLCTVAVTGRLTGDEEPGLGPNILALLDRPSIRAAAIKVSAKEKSKQSSPSKSIETTNSTETPILSIESQAMDKYGDGKALDDYALLHNPISAHYEMLRKRKTGS